MRLTSRAKLILVWATVLIILLIVNSHLPSETTLSHLPN